MKQEKSVNHGEHGVHGETLAFRTLSQFSGRFPVLPVCPVVKKPFAS